MADITVDFSNVDLPSDVSLVLAQNSAVDDLRDLLSKALGLDEPEDQLLRDELVGVVAKLVDTYLGN